MRKTNRISYLYFITGIAISLYSFISEKVQTLNIHDTYFVFPPKDFGVLAFALFGCIGLVYSVIEKEMHSTLKTLQFFSFTIPFVFYMLCDLINHNPGYYFTHQVVFKWEAIYIPRILFTFYLASILLFIYLTIVGIYKNFKSISAGT